MDNEYLIRKLVKLFQYKQNQLLKGKLLGSAVPNTLVDVQTKIGIKKALNLNITNATDDCLITKDIDNNQLVVFSLPKSNNTRNIEIINRKQKSINKVYKKSGYIICSGDSNEYELYEDNSNYEQVIANRNILLEWVTYLLTKTKTKKIYYKFTLVPLDFLMPILFENSTVLNNINQLNTGGVLICSTVFSNNEINKIKKFVLNNGLNLILINEYQYYLEQFNPSNNILLLQFGIPIKVEGTITDPDVTWTKYVNNKVNTINIYTGYAYGYFIKTDNTLITEDEILYTSDYNQKPTALLLDSKKYLK